MRKTKQGPPLFELLNRERGTASETLKVPGWWSANDQPDHEDQDVELRVVRPGGSDEGGKVESSTVEPPDAALNGSAGDSDVAMPLWELVGGRIRVSLTSVMAAVVVFVALVGVLGAFEIGRRSGEKTAFRRGYEMGRQSYAADAMSEIEIARSQPPATYVVKDLLVDKASSGAAVSGADGDSTAAGTTHWVRNYTYVVAQEFSADRADEARKAREYLARHGIETAFVQSTGGAIQLITTQGYNHKDPTQKQLAEEFLKRQHAVGAKYFAAGGGYRLKGYFRTLKDDTW